MADLSFELEGLEETLDELDRLEERWTGGKGWVIGTAVEYSVTPMPSLNRTNSGKRYVEP